MKTSKLRVIKHYDKLSQETQEQIKLVFPEGYSQHLIEFKDKEGNIISGLPFETDEKIYMIKMSVKMAKQIILDDDDYDDDGSLLEDVKEKYEDEHSDVDYLSENENYEVN